jgi:hypothetical protein
MGIIIKFDKGIVINDNKPEVLTRGIYA